MALRKDIGMLHGKVALITGAASGIGRAVCRLFSAEGASVAAVDVNSLGLEKTIQQCASDEVEELFGKVREQFGAHPAVVINCAAIAEEIPFLDITEKHFDSMITTNLKSVFLVTQMASKFIVSSHIKDASIVNIASIHAKSPWPGYCHYGASKAGVVALTKGVAKEMAPHGVRCNVLCPGAVDTPMLRANVQAGTTTMEGLDKKIPMGRIGRPEEIAEACLFLASDKGSYITGACLEITGGDGI